MKGSKDTFLKGIENLKVIGQEEQFGIMTSLKIFFFYVVLCCLAKYQEIEGKVFLVNGESERKRKDPTGGEYKRLYARRFSNSIDDLINKWTVVSPLSKRVRFRVIIHALFHSPCGGHYKGRYLEFLLLNRLFTCSNISETASFGHYDEFTYWLSEISTNYHIKYSMFQHGVVSDKIELPTKIKCNEIWLYNNYSEKAFRERIIENENCVYHSNIFISNVTFKNINREKRKFYVGIIDQTYEVWLKELVEAIKDLENVVEVIMLHPLSKLRDAECKENIIITKDKYFNLDCIISESSTLFLDYFYAGYKGAMICTKSEIVEEVFGEYPLIYVEKKEIAKKVLQLKLECEVADAENTNSKNHS